MCDECNGHAVGGPVRSIDAAAIAVRDAAQKFSARLPVAAENCVQTIDHTAQQVAVAAADFDKLMLDLRARCDAILSRVEKILGL